MSRENVEVARSIDQACNRRDLAQASEPADPDFEWIPDGRSIDTAIRGREDVQRFVQDQIEVLGLSVDPEEFFQKGGQVIAFIRVHGRGQAGGVEVDIRIAHVWTFRGRHSRARTGVRGTRPGPRSRRAAGVGVAPA